jgi:hypothetical protein
MATATLKTPRSKLRVTAYMLLAIIAAALAWFAFNFTSIKAQANLGVNYAAHLACSCHYIQGRDLESCQTDFEPGMEAVSIADDPANKRITATVPLLGKAMAEYRGVSGCIPLNDKELDAAG